MNLKILLKEYLQQEKLQAEVKFSKLEALYNSSLESDSGSRVLPKEYIAYLKRERDLAYMLFLLKTKECAELETATLNQWLQTKNIESI